MSDPHCSKCCPVKPPPPAAPVVWPSGMYLWLGVIIIVVVGGWALLMWGLASLSP